MSQINKLSKKVRIQNFTKEVLSYFEELEQEQIEPFQVISRNHVLEKMRRFIKYYKETFPKNKSSIPERLAKVLKCKTSRIEIGEQKSVPESELSDSSTEIKSTRNDKGMEMRCKIWFYCLDCTEKMIEIKVDELNEILERGSELGREFVMITIVAPIYFKNKISRKTLCDLFHKVIKIIFGHDTKLLNERFHILGTHRIEELTWRLDNFENLNHGHFILEFENKGERVEFQKLEKEFKEYVFKRMKRVFRNYEIEGEEYTKQNSVYFSKEEFINPETEMRDLVVLENGEYFRKTYEKDSEILKRISDYRVEYFSANSKNFNKEKRVFRKTTEEDLELIKRFYSEVLPKYNSRGNKTFCLHNWIMAMLGGAITKEDEELKKVDKKAYAKRMKLKMFGFKKMFQTFDCYYGDKKEGISRLPSILYPQWSFSRKSVKSVGGRKEITSRAKEKRVQRYENIKNEKLLKEKDCRIRLKAKLTQDEGIKKNAEENRYRIEEISEIKKKLTDTIGLSLDKIDKEILHRTISVHSITWEISDYLNWELMEDVTTDDLYRCLIEDDFKEYDRLDTEKGLEKLYNFTEKYKVDRSGVRINHFRFEGDKYCKYFPYIRVDKELEEKFIERTGLTLREFDELEVIYSIKELEEIIKELCKNARDKKRDKISEEEFNNNVGRIISKLREFDREHPTNRSKYY